VLEVGVTSSGAGFATGIWVGVTSLRVRVCIGTVPEVNTMTEVGVMSSGAGFATGIPEVGVTSSSVGVAIGTIPEVKK